MGGKVIFEKHNMEYGRKVPELFFLKTTQFSFTSCSIHLGRYNMIFVETSAKDNTGVEQVTIHIFPPTKPILSFAFCNRRICRLSWSWWTECCKAQAFGAPAKHLPVLLPHRLDLPSWGEEQTSKCKLKFLFSGLNKEEPPVPRLAVEPK